jgi:DNA invertase Pin-like site-specific DNA recombinase
MTVDDLDVTIHFVKENAVVSKESRSSEKFLHGIKVLMAKNYVDNLSEEVKKGLLEKAEQGHWPSRAPVGYVDDLATHRIEIDKTRAPLIAKLFEWYATGEYSLNALTAKAHAASLTHPRSGLRDNSGAASSRVRTTPQQVERSVVPQRRARRRTTPLIREQPPSGHACVAVQSRSS